MSKIILSQLYIYPIKSARGIALGNATVDRRGLRHDRRWMLADDSGRFISQRKFPRMALIRPVFKSDHLLVEAPGMPALEVPLSPPGGQRTLADLWGDAVEVSPVGPDADHWFSEFLNTACSLVHLPEDSVRPVDPHYGLPEDSVSFADGFPFLLISEASLKDLNSYLEEPLPMNRFRPNLVVRGCKPFAEDGWMRVRIGQLVFRVVKPCARCSITTVDQTKGVRGREPLRTLARYRKVGSKVLFGQNLTHDATGTVRVGDTLEVVSYRHDAPESTAKLEESRNL